MTDAESSGCMIHPHPGCDRLLSVYQMSRQKWAVTTAPVTVTTSANALVSLRLDVLPVVNNGSTAITFINNSVSISSLQTLLGRNTALFVGSGYLYSNQTRDLILDGDFSIDGWWYCSDNNPNAAVYHVIFELGFGDQNRDTSNGILLRHFNADNPNVYVNGVTIGRLSSTWWPNLAWNYFMMTRSNSTVSLYANGIQRLTYTGITGPINKGGHSLYIGRAQHTNGQYFQGNICNFRIIKGTALPGTVVPSTPLWLQTANGVPSTQPLT